MPILNCNLTNFLINESEQLKSIKEIIDYINNLSNKSFSKVIKIYILKLIFNFKKSNFEEFKKIKFGAVIPSETFSPLLKK